MYDHSGVLCLCMEPRRNEKDRETDKEREIKGGGKRSKYIYGEKDTLSRGGSKMERQREERKRLYLDF